MKAKSSPFVFLDAQGPSRGQGLLFEDPIKIITTTRAEEVEACLETMQQHISNGAYLAGFISYEAGYVFEPKLRPLLPEKLDTPFLWFGVFKPPQKMKESNIETWLQHCAVKLKPVPKIKPTLNQQTYTQKFNAVRDYIEKGDIYQANLTFKGKFEYSGCPFALYESLRHGQQTAYGGMIETGDETYLSLSPELFFNIDDGALTCRPMKGTARREVTASKDQAIKNWLKSDQKSQAENLMIVDLMRNDMSRISKPGSVEVTDLYSVETYPTLHQMTSGIRSDLNKNISLSDVIRNIFPCGSVTGAPKLRAMEIIHELEDEPRGIYTGAIGFISPNGDARFNVAIRTLKLTEEEGEIGIGSGLVADSLPQEEYRECLLKMRFLEMPHPQFDLLETLKWSPHSGYALLGFHLDRLEKSAHYFAYDFDRKSLQTRLEDYAKDFSQNPQRVRLLLAKNGQLTLTHTPLQETQDTAIWSFAISEKRVNINNPYLYHKTTHRRFYDEERERKKLQTHCDEVIFLNEKDQLTEGSFTNIFIRKNTRLLTPARECGLLDGTLRRELLERNEDPAFEAILSLEDLEQADEIFLGNSVRGLIPARLVHDLTPA